MPYSVYGIYGAYIFDELKTLVSTYIRRIYIYIHQRWSDAYTAYTPYIYKHWSDVYAAYTVYIHIYQRWSDVYTAYTPSKYITDADALRGSQRCIYIYINAGLTYIRRIRRLNISQTPMHYAAANGQYDALETLAWEVKDAGLVQCAQGRRPIGIYFVFFYKMFFCRRLLNVYTLHSALSPLLNFFSHKKKDMARKGRCHRLLKELDKDFERELEIEEEKERAQTAANELHHSSQGWRSYVSYGMHVSSSSYDTHRLQMSFITRHKVGVHMCTSRHMCACHMRRRIHACHMRRRIHACHMRRRIHACHMRRRIHAPDTATAGPGTWTRPRQSIVDS